MDRISIKGYGKINLSLNVLRKRNDGYHEVEMVMQQIDLFDLVSVEILNNVEKPNNTEALKNLRNQGDSVELFPEIIIKTGAKNIPKDRRNLAYKGCMVFLKKLEDHSLANSIIEIQIDKKIPVSAGLAGGSTDAAAAMIGLNILLGRPIPNGELIALGKEVGADVPFCIMGNLFNFFRDENKSVEDLSSCALAEGIGERLTPISINKDNNSLRNTTILLSKPNIYLSTKEVYSKLNLEEIFEKPNTKELIRGILNGNISQIKRNMINALESVTLKEYPMVVYTKNIMNMCRADAVLMSGSGPSVYGIFIEESLALKAFDILKGFNEETFLVKIK